MARRRQNSTLASAVAELRLVSGVPLLGKFDGQLTNHSQTYAGTFTVRESDRWPPNAALCITANLTG
jgi:hypothetical protein